MRVRALFCSMIIVCLSISITYAQTNVSGVLNDNTVWDITGSPYVVTSTVTIAEDSLLTIRPGVEVKFNAGTSFLVQGKLLAIGKSDSVILFTSNAGIPSPGDWGEIEIASSADPASRMEYNNIEYGGGGSRGANLFFATGAPSFPLSHDSLRYGSGDGLAVRTASPNITACTFHDNGNWGIFGDILINSIMDSVVTINNATGGIRIPNNAHPTITNATIENNDVGIFTGNGAYPLVTDSDIRNNRIGLESIIDGDATLHNCNIVGNTDYGIYHPGTNRMDARQNYWGDRNGPYNAFYNPAGGGDAITNTVDFEPFIATQIITDIVNVSGTIGVNTVWDHDMYVVTGNLTLNSGILLTINPNVVIKVQNGVNLLFRGTLIAAGKADSQIVFTSYKDDSYGGDTNGDGDLTNPAPSDWRALDFTSGSAASVLKNAIVKFGAGYPSAGLVQMGGGSTPTIDSCYISRGDRGGLYIAHGTSSTVTSTYVTGNNGYGIQLQSNSEVSFQQCVVQGNGNDGLYSNNGSVPTVINECTFENNNGNGVTVIGANVAQTITNNNFINNNGIGIYDINSLSTNPSNLYVNSNVFQDNTSDGLVSSAALITENTFQGNRYPIAMTGRLGNRYIDGGIDNNQFIDNTFNNTIGFRGDVSVWDTLSTHFPANITSGVYTVENSDPTVDNGKNLVIQNGLVVKFESNRNLRLNGNLEAVGQPDSIVFTSWRDSEYGGKTNALTDTLPPAPGDWRSLYFNSSGSSGSSLSYLIFRYGGRYYDYSPVVMNNNVNTISNSTMLYSQYHGISIYNADITILDCVIDTCNQRAINVTGGNSDVKVLNSMIRYNGYTGNYNALEATGDGSFREISNCWILNNNRDGIYSNSSTLPMTIVGNHIEGNGGHGIRIIANAVLPEDFDISGNFILNNTGDGVVSSGATYVDNTISGNRYPISVTGRLGNIYVDDQGEDGNIFENNTFNNALGIRNDSPLSDTLSIDFPDSISSSTYVVYEGDPQVNNGSTLVIDPGVIVKFDDNRSLRINGTLIAAGTPGPHSPIVFTSRRDTTYGGKTNAATDTLPPAPGDWRNLYMNGSGANASQLEYLIFDYGGRYYDYAPLSFNNTNLSVSHLEIHHSMYDGIRVNNSVVTVDSTTIDSCRQSGIRLEGGNSDVSVRGCVIMDNGLQGTYPGLLANNGATFREISGTEIGRSGGSGIDCDAGLLPQTYLNNHIFGNNGDGIFNNSLNDAIDSLLTITGNTIENNTYEGIVSSRAQIKDNMIRGNRYPIAVMGQLSLTGTGNEFGNVYVDNQFEDNQYTNIVGIRGDISLDGILGGAFPDTVTSGSMAVINNTSVASGKTVTIVPGTILKFHSGVYLDSYGQLTARGTPDSRIVFTSWKDDSFGGDTNADSSLTTPAPGDWRYVRANGAGSNASTFRQCIVRFGGSNNGPSLALSSTNAHLDTSFISFSGRVGISIYNSGGTYTALSVHDNYRGIEISSTGGTVPTIHQSNIYSNTQYGVINTSTSYMVDATYNYWGDDTGPYHGTLNPSGLGNAVSDGVQFIPFLGQQQGPLLGDVSLNGTVTAYDAALVLRHIVHLDTLTVNQQEVADVSGNGEISAYDASLILQYVAGIIIAFPGAGKPLAADVLAEGIHLDAGVVKSGEFVDIPLQLNGGLPISSIDIQLSGDPKVIAGIEATKVVGDDAGILVANNYDGITRIAYATSKIEENRKNLISLRIYAQPDLLDKIPTVINIQKFSVNEVDLTNRFNQLSLEIIGTPSTFELAQNYPNPFNPSTTIKYQLPFDSKVLLVIYDLRGKEVCRLVNQSQAAGYYDIFWDGKDHYGRSVASGIYFYRITSSPVDKGKSYKDVKKMTVVK